MKKFSAGKLIRASSVRPVLIDSKDQIENPARFQANNQVLNLLDETQGILEGKLDKDSPISVDQLDGFLDYRKGGANTGTYLPILTNIANITSSGVYFLPWILFGGVTRQVQVSGKVAIEPTAPGVFTQLELTLPMATLFTHSEQASGVANGIPFSGATEGWAGIVEAYPPNGTVRIECYPQDAVNFDVRFVFTYQFIPY